MSPQDLSPTVRTFLVEHIGTLAHFTLLMRLIQIPERWWDARTAARELGMTGPDARTALDDLARENLLDIRVTDDVRFRYQPGTSALAAAVTASSDAFRRQPRAVLQVLTPARPPGLRNAAGAPPVEHDPEDDR